VSSSAMKSVLDSMPGSVLQSVLRAWVGAYSPVGGSVSSSAIGSVLESMLGSVLESFLRACFGVYSLSGWLCTIEYKWERPWEHARECTSVRTRRCT
jgi:hypothetical protein